MTLFELVAVLAVLALGAMLITSRPSAGAVSQRTAVLEMAAALREARAQALRSGAPAEVLVDVEAAFVVKADGTTFSLPASAGLIVTGASMQDDGLVSLRFLPSGMATGGSVVIGRRAVLVDWLTGRVTIGEAA
ncbi:hypothetical protein NOG11_14035 [Parvularcula sp. BGMRC 0090]|uniref:Type II secretion system protein H n=1 Tax=Parvularcula maris TaxID=2965077 RepID=A0A9X2RL62_9PROT|nr:GspH/FimT family pseudopilin [Parvularcula maris]MCQ8186498.1 hypothetical protein [Parvularcula maris]